MLFCMDDFVLSVLEGREMGSFVGSFDGTGGDMCGPCVGIVVGGIMTASDIDDIQLNESLPVSCKA